MNGIIRKEALVVAITATLAVAGASGGAFAQDDKEAHPHETSLSPEQKAMMEAWQAYASPGEGHKILEGFVGTWDAKVTFMMEPGGEGMQSAGTSEMSWLLGNRFLMQKFEGAAMGEGASFSGIGITGYNNGTKKFESIWVDNEGTGMMITSGTVDAAGKVITQHGEYYDPSIKKMVKFRYVTRIVSPTKVVFEMHKPDQSGKEYKCLEVAYTKKS